MRPREPPRTPVDDGAVLDAIALILADSPDWGGDELTAIADTVATVRPHPGDYRTAAAYRRALHHERTPQP